MPGTPEVDEVLENVKIISVGTKGDGICKTDNGFIIFVKEAKKGEVLDIKVKKVFDKYAFAEIVKRHSTS